MLSLALHPNSDVTCKRLHFSFLSYSGNTVIENCNPCAVWLISPCITLYLLRSDVHVQIHLPWVV